MLRACKILAMLIVGVALGLAVTWATAIRSIGVGVKDGPWATNLYTGSSEGGPYLRARIAVHGLLALSREEAMYYTALTDSDGAVFDGGCTYHLEGRDPPSRWWSITAYGADDFLIPNEFDRYSVSMNSLIRNRDGSFAVTLSKARADGNWVPVIPGRFDLTIRLYNPQAEVVADPAHVPLPVVKKVSCE
jgi:hypothetical protein